MPRLIDLSIPLGHPDIPDIPSFPPMELWQFHKLPTHGRQNSGVRMPTHMGTHIDAPRHFVPGGATVDEMPLDIFTGRAVKIDLRAAAKPGQAITRTQIEAAPGFDPKRLEGNIPISWTGWSKAMIQSTDYYARNPYLDPEACAFLCDCGMKALCMDHAIDPGPGADFVPAAGDAPGHRTLLGRGIPIIEHVINLETFEETEFEMFAFPIRLYQIEGAPARVVARVG